VNTLMAFMSYIAKEWWAWTDAASAIAAAIAMPIPRRALS
jgi:hypothetical protein